MKDVQIGSHSIGAGHRPFIIAEMSGNHGQSLDRAIALVDAAAASGAHAIKLQTYTPDSMTLDVGEGNFFIDDPDNLWKGQTLYDLYQKAYTPWEWHNDLFQRAREKKILAFSTPFSEGAVDQLESLDVACYKIASFENSDLPLIRKAAGTGKPLIMSIGMATLSELTEAVETAKENGCNELILLKCTSVYPASPADTNLRTIPHLQDLFDCQVGLSDHTLGTAVATAAVAQSATVIEKHLTLSRADKDVDAAFSLQPEEFGELVTATGLAWQALGKITYGPTDGEIASRRYRRSLYVARDMKKGDVFTCKNLACVRPAGGLAPRYKDLILGRTVTTDVRKGTPLRWDLI